MKEEKVCSHKMSISSCFEFVIIASALYQLIETEDPGKISSLWKLWHLIHDNVTTYQEVCVWKNSDMANNRGLGVS